MSYNLDLENGVDQVIQLRRERDAALEAIRDLLNALEALNIMGAKRIGKSALNDACRNAWELLPENVR